LYFGRLIGGSLLSLLSTIASKECLPNEDTMYRIQHVIDYVATQEDAVLPYRASDVALAVDSDAGYTNMPRARRRVRGLTSCQLKRYPTAKPITTEISTYQQGCHLMDSRSRLRCTLCNCQ
jgi:hypothetical protein